MKALLALDCRMELTLRTAPGEKSPIYDFFWDHAPHLFRELNQKEVDVKIALPPSNPKAKNARAKDNQRALDAFIQKFSNEKRFKARTTHRANPGTRTMHVRIPVHHLENALSAYNILFDAGLTSTTLASPALVIDFTHAHTNKVRVFTTLKQHEHVKDFLAAKLPAPLHVHTLKVVNPHPLQAHLNAREWHA